MLYLIDFTCIHIFKNDIFFKQGIEIDFSGKQLEVRLSPRAIYDHYSLTKTLDMW